MEITNNMSDTDIVNTILKHGYLLVMNDQQGYEVLDETGELEPREALIDSLRTYINSQEG